MLLPTPSHLSPPPPVLVSVGMRPRALCMLTKHLATKSHLQPPQHLCKIWMLQDLPVLCGQWQGRRCAA